jgi:hypothetical protein
MKVLITALQFKYDICSPQIYASAAAGNKGGISIGYCFNDFFSQFYNHKSFFPKEFFWPMTSKGAALASLHGGANFVF